MNKPLFDGFHMPNGEYRYLDSMDNLDWYNAGRADQRKRDWPVIAAIAIAAAIWIVFVER